MNKNYIYFTVILLSVLGMADPAHASFLDDLFGDIKNDLSDVSGNIINSIGTLPGILTGISYLLALLMGVTGIFKLKDHVENPSQTPIRISMIRFIIGGALLALPIIYEAMEFSISGGDNGTFDPSTFSFSGAFSGLSGTVASVVGSLGVNEDLNFVMASIVSSVRAVPDLIAAVAYLLGLLFGVLGLIKIKDHVENPDQNALKDGVIRLIVGGALFALPTMFYAMTSLWSGDGSSTIAGIVNLVNDLAGLLGGGAGCDTVGGAFSSITGTGATSLGNAMCNLVLHTSAFTSFLEALAYLFGLVIGFWGILKVKEHVDNPGQTSIWEGISRFITAGAFFSFPFVIEVIKNTIVPESVLGTAFGVGNIIDGGLAVVGFIANVFADPGAAIDAGLCAINLGDCPPAADGPSCDGLDRAVSCFVNDIFLPFSTMVSTFSTFAGMLLIMIGISRLMKSAQEGAKGPIGMGTIMTFLTGGALVSYNSLLGTFSSSFFNSDKTLTYGKLVYSTGMTNDEITRVQTVISSITQFVLLVGLVSFVRGIFIVRGVAEGNQQSSMMAGITHLIGGTLAVNLGPLMNVVQSTLGISTYGIEFVTGP